MIMFPPLTAMICTSPELINPSYSSGGICDLSHTSIHNINQDSLFSPYAFITFSWSHLLIFCKKPIFEPPPL